MNNKFIPFISVLMTISLIVFVVLQFYWIKELYTALNQEFSNKVYSAMESSTQKVAQLEVDKYLNQEYKNFGKNVVAGNGSQPTQTYIQQNTDSANRSTITFQKSIVESQNIPISRRGDSLKLTKLYTDEGILKIKKENTSEPLTAQLSKDINNNTYALREFAKLSASSLPIEKRVDEKTLDSVLTQELKLNGLNTKFGFAVLNNKNEVTKITSKIFNEKKNKDSYTYPLFTDSKDRTLYTLALVFPDDDYYLAKNNLPMLLGTIMSLLTILGIYIISINYMMRQKKIAEVKTFEIGANETPEGLAEKVHAVEYDIFPKAINKILNYK